MEKCKKFSFFHLSKKQKTPKGAIRCFRQTIQKIKKIRESSERRRLHILEMPHLVYTGISDSGKLNKLAASYVKATEQSRAFSRMEPHLTEEEMIAYKRGRNLSGISIPHSAKATEYRRATGVEALFAYLYLQGEEARIRELFALAFPQDEEENNS